MPFSEKTKNEIDEYCSNHLPEDAWYENEFDFILDTNLRNRLIQEFKSIRFAYKLYEGIAAEDENLIFEVRNQILGYASIYEAIIENVLETYYSDTTEYDDMMHHVVPVQISIPEHKKVRLQAELEHDGHEIVPFNFKRKKKDKPQIRFDEKCETAKKLGLIKPIVGTDENIIDLPAELIEIYGFRNGIHLIAEQRKGINYELELSKRAYKRMRPFVDQVKEKLKLDGKY